MVLGSSVVLVVLVVVVVLAGVTSGSSILIDKLKCYKVCLSFKVPLAGTGGAGSSALSPSFTGLYLQQ